MNAYVKLTRAGLRAFARDRAGLFWSFFFPLFFIIIFGSIFGQDNENAASKFTIGLVTPDSSPAAAWVPDVFRRVFDTRVGSLPAEQEALRAGKRRAVLVFPPDFSERLMNRQPSEVKVYFDPSQQQTNPIVLGIVRQVIAGIDQRMSGAPTLLKAQEEPLTGKTDSAHKMRGIDFLLPGILAMTIMQLGLFTAIPMVNLREKGVLKRLRATPLTRSTFVASQITQRLVIGVFQTLIIVAVGTLLFKFHVAGSWAGLLSLVMLGVLTFICIGAILSTFAKSQESAAPMVQLVMFPMMFLSGLFFPLDLMPAYMQPISKALPTTYLADALRAVMVAAPSTYSITVDLAVMGAWLLGGLLLAAKTFRWE